MYQSLGQEQIPISRPSWRIINTFNPWLILISKREHII